MTQVPLGQSLVKFPNIRFSKPEFTKKETTGSTSKTDLEFLINLTEDRRLIIEEGSITTTGDMITITPDTGTTFFFLGAVVQNTDPSAGDASLINNGTTRELVTLQPDEIYEFKLPIDRLVGNMSNTFQLRGLSANISMQGSLYGWTENTKKIS